MRSSRSQRLVSLVLALSLFGNASPSLGADAPPGVPAGLAGGPGNAAAVGMTAATEFYAGSVPGEVLIPINVIGAVNRAGLYHVPGHTDLLRLIALAGGVRDDADFEEAVLRRRNGAEEQVLHLGLNDLQSAEAMAPLKLEPDDVLVIPYKQPLVSQNTVTLVGLIASIASLILSVKILSER